MSDLQDGEVTHVQGSAATPYELRNTGGVYSCTCPAWRNQSAAIDRRTCKHLKGLRGEAVERARVGAPASAAAPRPAAPATAGGRARAVAKETAPPVLLAHPWANDLDLTGWWISEKLDGVRAYWDGRAFLSRLGNAFLAPAWFTAGLPDHPLDGELWLGRQRFQETIGVVRRADAGEAWREVRYVLFDVPALDAPFEERVAHLHERFPEGRHAHAHAIAHVRCEGLAHLRRELARVEALGGEGLMLRQPGSRYVAGRSSTLLKVKSFHDAEARVLRHLPGTGRHRGRLGALRVELPDGTAFSVGTGLSDREREDPPPVGAVVTFRYQELSRTGVPRFPSYVGLRVDLAWPPDAPAPAPGAAPAPAPTPTPVAPAAGPVTARRRLELVLGSSSKFWEVRVEGASHTVTFGRLGSAGQSRTKAFASAAAAQADAARLVAEKTRKGYVEVAGPA